jgi:hypothetical protein
MTRRSLLTRCHPVAVAVALTCLMSAVPIAGQFKWLTGDRATKYDAYKDPDGRFEMEVPAKDWRQLPSNSSSTLVGFSRNDGPTLFVDYVKLRDRLTKAELDVMSDVEVARLKDLQPKATGFKAELLESRSGSGVLIRYSRPGASGNTNEAVIQYSVAANLDLYRVNGVVQEKQLSKYQPVIMHMIQSFQSKAVSPAAKPAP